MFKGIGLLVFLLAISNSFAKSNCEEINFYDDPFSPLHQMDVCDQGPLGVCYATSAAQLINYQLGRQKGSKAAAQVAVHPLWIAYLYKQDEKGFSSGLTDKSANIIRRHGICPAPVVEKSIKDFVGNAWMNGYQLFCLIEKFETEWKGEKEARQAFQSAHRKCMGWSYFNEDIYDKVIDLVTDNKGNIQKPSAFKMAKNIFNSCYTPGVIQKKNIQRLDAECEWCTDSEIKEKVSEFLKKDKMVGVDYCARVLDNKNYSGLSSGRNAYFQLLPRGSKVVDPNKCGNHASVLVGQKKINNKCHYLLRNSWGNRKYQQWPNCVCEEYDGTTVDCQYGKPPYKAVSCWVGADELAKNTYRLISY